MKKVPQHENKDHREERKKVKKQVNRKQIRIIESRSESRKDLLTPKFKDPRITIHTSQREKTKIVWTKPSNKQNNEGKGRKEGIQRSSKNNQRFNSGSE